MMHFGAVNPEELVKKFEKFKGKVDKTKKNIKTAKKAVRITGMALGVGAVAAILYFVLRKKK